MGKIFFKKLLTFFILFSFLLQNISYSAYGQIGPINPPALNFNPATLRYLSVNSANPYNYFNFLLDQGTSSRGGLNLPYSVDNLNQEAKKLVNYFFLGITLADSAFWVNLRPDEPGRITSEELAKTDMGKALLGQDLQLKKDMARLLHPQNSVGKVFWERLYLGLEKKLGKDKIKKISVNTSNRVWIVPDQAVVMETEDGAFVVSSTLKVLLEGEYCNLVSRSAVGSKPNNDDGVQFFAGQIMKETIIPEITREVNFGKNYAELRQIYQSLILAQWFKRKYKDSKGIYPEAINKGFTQGLESGLPWSKQQIWQDYLESYKQGEYRIKEKLAGLNRMYFSGGMDLTGKINISITSAASALSSNLIRPNDLRNLVPVLTENNKTGSSSIAPEEMRVIGQGISGERLKTPEPLALQPVYNNGTQIIKVCNIWLEKANSLAQEGKFVEARDAYRKVYEAVRFYTKLDDKMLSSLNERYQEVLEKAGINTEIKVDGLTWQGRHNELFDGLVKLLISKSLAAKKPLKIVVFGIGGKGAPTVFDLLGKFADNHFNNLKIYGIDKDSEYLKSAEEQNTHPGLLEFIDNKGSFDLKELGLTDIDIILAPNALSYYFPVEQMVAINLLRESLSPEGSLLDVRGPGKEGASYQVIPYSKDGHEVDLNFGKTAGSALVETNSNAGLDKVKSASSAVKEYVGLNDDKVILAQKGALYTDSLASCVGIAFRGENDKGESLLWLAHLLPETIDQRIFELQEKIKNNHLTKITDLVIVLMAAQAPVIEKLNQSTIKLVESVIKEDFDKPINTRIVRTKGSGGLAINKDAISAYDGKKMVLKLEFSLGQGPSLVMNGSLKKPFIFSLAAHFAGIALFLFAPHLPVADHEKTITVNLVQEKEPQEKKIVSENIKNIPKVLNTNPQQQPRKDDPIKPSQGISRLPSSGDAPLLVKKSPASFIQPAAGKTEAEMLKDLEKLGNEGKILKPGDNLRKSLGLPEEATQARPPRINDGPSNNLVPELLNKKPLEGSGHQISQVGNLPVYHLLYSSLPKLGETFDRYAAYADMGLGVLKNGELERMQTKDKFLGNSDFGERETFFKGYNADTERLAEFYTQVELRRERLNAQEKSLKQWLLKKGFIGKTDTGYKAIKKVAFMGSSSELAGKYRSSIDNHEFIHSLFEIDDIFKSEVEQIWKSLGRDDATDKEKKIMEFFQNLFRLMKYSNNVWESEFAGYASDPSLLIDRIKNVREQGYVYSPHGRVSQYNKDLSVKVLKDILEPRPWKSDKQPSGTYISPEAAGVLKDISRRLSEAVNESLKRNNRQQMLNSGTSIYDEPVSVYQGVPFGGASYWISMESFEGSHEECLRRVAGFKTSNQNKKSNQGKISSYIQRNKYNPQDTFRISWGKNNKLSEIIWLRKAGEVSLQRTVETRLASLEKFNSSVYLKAIGDTLRSKDWSKHEFFNIALPVNLAGERFKLGVSTGTVTDGAGDDRQTSQSVRIEFSQGDKIDSDRDLVSLGKGRTAYEAFLKAQDEAIKSAPYHAIDFTVHPSFEKMTLEKAVDLIGASLVKVSTSHFEAVKEVVFDGRKLRLHFIQHFNEGGMISKSSYDTRLGLEGENGEVYRGLGVKLENSDKIKGLREAEKKLLEKIKSNRHEPSSSSALGEKQAVSSEVEAILAKIGFNIKYLERIKNDLDGWHEGEMLYDRIINRLNHNEHTLLLDFLWNKNGPQGLKFPATLVEKFLKNINSEDMVEMIYDVFFRGEINQFDLETIKKNIEISDEEEAFLWEIFYSSREGRSNRAGLMPSTKEAVDEIINSSTGKVNILELGCGLEGKVLRSLKKEHADKIDEAWGINLKIIDNSADGVRLVEGNIKAMPFENAKFDLAYEQMVMMYFHQNDSEFRKVISEVMRILRPGGKFVFRISDMPLERVKDTIKDLNIDAVASQESKIAPVLQANTDGTVSRAQSALLGPIIITKKETVSSAITQEPKSTYEVDLGKSAGSALGEKQSAEAELAKIKNLYLQANQAAAAGAFKQAAAVYEQIIDGLNKLDAAEKDKISLLAFRAPNNLQVIQRLADLYPSREIKLDELSNFAPGVTYPGRLKATHAYILSLINNLPDKKQALVVDVGTGYIPSTTQELAGETQGAAKVIGVDKIIPPIILEIVTREDGTQLPYGSQITAFFNEDGQLIYSFSEGEVLFPARLELVFAIKDRLFSQMKQGALPGESYMVKDDFGNSLSYHPFKQYEMPNLEFRQGDIFDLPLKDGEKADIARIFNLLQYYRGREKEILEKLAAKVKDNGYIVVGNVNANVMIGRMEFLTFQKTPDGLIPVNLGTEVLFPEEGVRTSMSAGGVAIETLFRDYRDFWWDGVDRVAQEVWDNFSKTTLDREVLVRKLLGELDKEGYKVSRSGDTTLVFDLDSSGKVLRNVAESVSSSVDIDKLKEVAEEIFFIHLKENNFDLNTSNYGRRVDVFITLLPTLVKGVLSLKQQNEIEALFKGEKEYRPEIIQRFEEYKKQQAALALKKGPRTVSSSLDKEVPADEAKDIVMRTSTELKELRTFCHDMEIPLVYTLGFMVNIIDKKITKLGFNKDNNLLIREIRDKVAALMKDLDTGENSKKKQRNKYTREIEKWLKLIEKSGLMLESDKEVFKENLKSLKNLIPEYSSSLRKMQEVTFELKAFLPAIPEGNSKDTIKEFIGRAEEGILKVMILINESSNERLLMKGDLDDYLNRYALSAGMYNKNVNVSYKGTKKSVWVNFNEVDLSRVMDNLINNAIKHGFGGQESIANEPEKERKIEISLEVADGNAQISIKDNGRGMEADIIDKIFDYEFTTATDPEKGTGLGLSSAEEIIKTIHKGQIPRPESNKGVGTTFKIILPLASSSSAVRNFLPMQLALEQLKSDLKNWSKEYPQILLLLDGVTEVSGEKTGKTKLAEAIDLDEGVVDYYGPGIKNLGLDSEQKILIVRGDSVASDVKDIQDGTMIIMPGDTERRKLPNLVLLDMQKQIKNARYYGQFLKAYIDELYSRLGSTGNQAKIILYDEAGSHFNFQDVFQGKPNKPTLVVKLFVKLDSQGRQMSTEPYEWLTEKKSISQDAGEVRIAPKGMSPDAYVEYMNVGIGGWKMQTATYASSNPVYRQWLIGQIGSGKRILSVGCGRGELEVELVRAGNQVVAFDAVPEMVEAARENSRKNNVSLPVLLADVHSLPKAIKDQKFDLILFSESVGNIDISGALKEVKSVLSDSGTLIITTYPSEENKTKSSQDKIKSDKGELIYQKISQTRLNEIVEKEAGFKLLESRLLDYPTYTVDVTLPGDIIYIKAQNSSSPTQDEQVSSRENLPQELSFVGFGGKTKEEALRETVGVLQTEAKEIEKAMNDSKIPQLIKAVEKLANRSKSAESTRNELKKALIVEISNLLDNVIRPRHSKYFSDTRRIKTSISMLPVEIYYDLIDKVVKALGNFNAGTDKFFEKGINSFILYMQLLKDIQDPQNISVNENEVAMMRDGNGQPKATYEILLAYNKLPKSKEASSALAPKPKDSGGASSSSLAKKTETVLKKHLGSVVDLDVLVNEIGSTKEKVVAEITRVNLNKDNPYLVDPSAGFGRMHIRTKKSKEASSALAPKPKDSGGASSSVNKKEGGIDFSQVEANLSRQIVETEAGPRPLLDIMAGKDDKYISSLNPADIKILRAAKALRDNWDSLSVLYIHEVMLLLKDNIVGDFQNKALLQNVLNQLKLRTFLDAQAIQFLQFIQLEKPTAEIKLALLSK